MKVTAPSASLSCAATVQVQSFPSVLVTVSALVASAPLNFIAHVGVPIVSEEVNARVIVFPSMLRSLSALLEFSVTEVSVGAVRSAVQAKVFDAVLPLVTESVNAPAATWTETAPLPVAVHVAEYDDPEPENELSEQPEAVMSVTTKSVVVSLETKVSAIAAVLVVSPLSIAADAIVMVGFVVSWVAKTFPELVPDTVAKTVTVPSETPLISAYVPVPSSSNKQENAPVVASAVTESVTPP